MKWFLTAVEMLLKTLFHFLLTKKYLFVKEFVEGVSFMNRPHLSLLTVFLIVTFDQMFGQQKDFGKARIVYSTQAMNQVDVKRGIKYHDTPNVSLAFDIYYPPNKDETTLLPAVIFVFGYPDSVIQKNLGVKLKDMGAYSSWCELIASSGVAAIAYETSEPEKNIKEIFNYITANSQKIMINPGRICIWSCSGNVPTALSLLASDLKIKCGVFFYGFMIEPPGNNKASEVAKKVGFVYPELLKNPELLRWDVPTLVVKAGKDNVPNIQPTIDNYISQALAHNSPIQFINYSTGQHAFDILDNNDESREIIKRTIHFIKYHLQ
jgi:dienelactone hydrolase